MRLGSILLQPFKLYQNLAGKKIEFFRKQVSTGRHWKVQGIDCVLGDRLTADLAEWSVAGMTEPLLVPRIGDCSEMFSVGGDRGESRRLSILKENQTYSQRRPRACWEEALDGGRNGSS